MPASAVSSPTAATRTRSAESVATVPAVTLSPSPLATGFDSPVTIDSSSSAWPATISPSAGTRAPGRTSTTSPTSSSASGMRSTVPSWTRSASSGSSSASALTAPRAWPSAFISCQCPSSMITTSADSSHQNSRSKRPSVEAALARKATVIASETSSIIPGARPRISDHAPLRKTDPP